MSFAHNMKEKARKAEKTIVFPEGHEGRTIQAARKVCDEKIAAKVTLVGIPQEIEEAARKVETDLSGIEVLDPWHSDKLEEFAQEYYELRKHKGMTLEQARGAIMDPLKWGALMVRKNSAHAMVAGAENSTANVLRAAFTIVGTAPGVEYASSCFVMVLPDPKWGAGGNMIFADCATIPDPTVPQLAEIAIASSESCRTFFGVEPVTAMLSYSTKGSGKGPNVEKVKEALEIARSKRPDLRIDGELQVDAALIPAIGKSKAPDSTVAGQANVLIFPDLTAGNIAYKLVQRIGGAQAFGPFLQGFAKPVSDLSRGCSCDDIVNTSAVTLAQADGQ